jgi:hypothetical protein
MGVFVDGFVDGKMPTANCCSLLHFSNNYDVIASD